MDEYLRDSRRNFYVHHRRGNRKCLKKRKSPKTVSNANTHTAAQRRTTAVLCVSTTVKSKNAALN